MVCTCACVHVFYMCLMFSAFATVHVLYLYVCSCFVHVRVFMFCTWACVHVLPLFETPPPPLELSSKKCCCIPTHVFVFISPFYSISKVMKCNIWMDICGWGWVGGGGGDRSAGVRNMVIFLTGVR